MICLEFFFSFYPYMCTFVLLGGILLEGVMMFCDMCYLEIAFHHQCENILQ